MDTAKQPWSGNSGGFYCGPKPAAGDPPQRICAQFRTVESLVWSVDSGKRLQVNNPGPYVVRLSNALRILPDVGTRMLPQTYILPGETITLSQPLPAAGNASRQIKIEPVDDDGLPIRGGYTAPLAQTSGR